MRAATLTDHVEPKDGLDVAMDARRRVAQTEAAEFDALVGYATGENHPAGHCSPTPWT